MEKCNCKGFGKSDDVTQNDFPHHSLLARGMGSHFGHPENLNLILDPAQSNLKLDP